uniref:Myb/SANT-like domain-containing protein n=1 Tax=Fagus sylvatica TaxID=28930 RepID=A0A2N9IJD7_FAGSY
MGKKNETLNLNPKPSQNNSNVRAQWTPQQITIFCEACVDEKDWVTWNKIKGIETRLGWDAAKGTIASTDEWWERKLAEVPKASKFQEKGLDNLDLLDIMFKDIAATRNLAWTPSSDVLPASFETPGGVRNSANLQESGSSIHNVMERVCTLDGVEKGSDLDLMVACIFQKGEKREIFVVMGEPHLQLKFLKDEAELLGRHYFTT